MYPLLLCSVIMVAIIFERMIVLGRANANGDDLLDEIKDAFEPNKDLVAAQKVVLDSKTPLGRIFARGLKNGNRSADAIEMAMELEASNEIPSLEANLPIIKTIVNIAPLLGLLGTIAGMIQAFEAASKAGLSNPTQILGGISEALVSTATGIMIAVIGFLAHNYFAHRTKKIIEDIEFFGAELVNLVTGRLD